MNLHHSRSAYVELLTLASAKLGIERYKIEKDYWLCKILKEVSLSEYRDMVFFKGGTSLLKGYGMIDRFSEDLDLFVYSGNPRSSKTAEKKLISDVSHFMITNNKGTYREKESSLGGNFRNLHFSYTEDTADTGLKQHLEVEIKCCDLSDKSLIYYPSTKRIISPIVTQFLDNISNTRLIEVFELTRFEVICIDPRKTLCDKISRLTRLSYNDDFETLIAKYIRDVYDIHCIVHNPEYIKFLKSDEFIEALKQVTDEDGLRQHFQSHSQVSKACIFAQTKETLNLPTILRAYKNDLRKLVFDSDSMPSLDEIIDTIASLQKVLQQFDEKYRI